jgi:hypothetical protein
MAYFMKESPLPSPRAEFRQRLVPLALAVCSLPLAATPDQLISNFTSTAWYLSILPDSEGKVEVLSLGAPPKTLQETGDCLTLTPHGGTPVLRFSRSEDGGEPFKIRMRLTDGTSTVRLLAKPGKPLKFLEPPDISPSPVTLDHECGLISIDWNTKGPDRRLANFTMADWFLTMLPDSKGKVKITHLGTTLKTLEATGDCFTVPRGGRVMPTLRFLDSDEFEEDFSIRMRLSDGFSAVRVIAKPGEPLAYLEEPDAFAGPVDLGRTDGLITIGWSASDRRAPVERYSMRVHEEPDAGSPPPAETKADQPGCCKVM